MKPIQILLLGILIGMTAAAVILIVASEPRGEPIELLPRTTPTELVIYISGSVAHPGVYHLSPGSRIDQAVTAAGGLAQDADADQADLARLLFDGDQVYIPHMGEPTRIPRRNWKPPDPATDRYQYRHRRGIGFPAGHWHGQSPEHHHLS